ncbi:MAG: hypothetical protein ACOC8D_02845 [bacterium]
MRTRRALGAAALVAAAWAAAADGQPVPVAFCIVPEMGYLPEVSDGTWCKPDAFPAVTAKALADWKTKRPWVAKRITPELVRRLSRWARKEMAEYRDVSSLEDVAFKAAYHHQARGKLVLEGTVDTLPSHSPLVTRWLKVFLLCDQGSGTVQRVTVTIRGQLLE